MKILVVDDSKDNLFLFEAILVRAGHEVLTAGNGVEALARLKDNHCDLIISDVLMPVMDGLQFCREVKGNPTLREIPFVFVTAAYTEEKDRQLAMGLGVERIIEKPIEPAAFLQIVEEVLAGAGAAVKSTLHLGTKEADFQQYSERLVEKLESRMAELETEILERKKAENLLQQSHDRLRQALESTIMAIVKAVEARDLYIAGHMRRVSQLASMIGMEMGLDDEIVEGLYLGASIHDIGKIHIPAEILGKPAKLAQIEFDLVKNHSLVGHEILKDIEFPWPVAEMVWQHHELLDGSGYPRGLRGAAIITEARIITVADVVEAMSCHRPYRPGLGIEAALAEITARRGQFYDERVVDACVRLFTEKREMFEEAWLGQDFCTR